jgi:FtsH-binding integral membrane protein
MNYPFVPQTALERPVTRALPYLRRVYGLFSGGIAFAIVGALLALYAGAPVEVGAGRGEIAVPPLVAFGLAHPIIMMLIYFGAFLFASFARRKPGVNVIALFGYTFVTGLFLAPALFIAQVMASQGHTLDASPVRDAFLLTGAAFGGLTTYVFVSKRDFSFIGAGLTIGLWVVLGASLLGIFVHSEVFQLAIASVGVLLFAGYILYDTSRILRDRDESDPVGAALRLFLDVVNLFVFLLRILSSSRDRS